ncbi:MAG: MotA/TolQ/ExbB proton channel family protein [Verrucomicrobiota bacterium]|nr:MotA/TolQ/ExbB proton channel family protein [Verrucomicrobiota bacterium]
MNTIFKIGLILLLTTGLAKAQEPDTNTNDLTLLQLVQEAGFLAWPLAALSIAAVFLIIFYTLTVRKGAVVSGRFMRSADSLIRKQDYIGLLKICNRQDQCISRITAKTVEFATKNPLASFEEVREVTEAEGSRQASLLHQRIQYLADIGAIAPMVGLLGTVVGMIKAFREIAQHSFVGSKQTGLASGVSEALLTTAGGLCIGIPALIFYSLFRGKVQGLVAELEAASTHIMALLAAQYKRASISKARAGKQKNETSRPADIQGI